GKTTFAQGFARGLGITTRLLSPTFIIVRRYPMPHDPGFLYHIDLYRVAGEKALIRLGLPEILVDPDSVVLVEWAEKLGSLSPRRRIDVHFSTKDDESHEVLVEDIK
ncbi:tRNA (adenosine(37)-N6)-threonylcarbamoyltransferase complex ATPase subunit type 1 TsaE, partial [Candidatus Gottesmanbacteria bacterium]|nr:tRNA (adenosine(37)-N6)-threonylcarbamoyltransferase complex ATPase subunit type 1 TsaE [Candidatus Gottesmanbacteria bacterium]